MASGSYLGNGQNDIGSRPGDFSAWDKIQLGWSNFDTASTGVYSEHKLGPAETNTKKAQAVIVTLPPEQNDLFLYNPALGALQYGTKAWWGGKADNADNTMTRTINVPASPATLNMRLNYQIESNWDYAYVQISNNGGTSWTNLAGTYLNTAGTQSALTTATNPNGQNLGNGITGSTANATNAPNGWRLAAFNLNAYAGQSVLLRLRYKTDAYTTLNGFLADEITLNGVAIDNAENGDNGWTLAGFKATNGLEKSNAPHYYIAEYRQYRTYDEGLKTGPYTFGRNAPYGSYVDHYAYQDGLLITYWDTTQANNNTSLHAGEGRMLPIDAHPEPLRRRQVSMGGSLWNFSPWSARVQAYDSTFGLEATDPLRIPFRGTLPGTINDSRCLPSGVNSVCEFSTEYPSLPGNREFDDNNTYWYAETAASGVIVPKTGTTIRVINTSAQGTMMKIEVNSALAPVTQ
jgi:immune inhibitor A